MNRKFTIAVGVISVILAAASCSVKVSTINEMLPGTWICEEINDVAVPTNSKFVDVFLTDGTYTYCAAFFESDVIRRWTESEMSYSVSNGKIHLEGTDVNKIKWESDWKIKTMTSTVMTYIVPSLKIDGVSYNDVNSYKLVKSTVDNSSSIIGLWEGKNVTSGATPSESALHRWEFLQDGTFVYYSYTELDENDDPIWFMDGPAGTYYTRGYLLSTNWNTHDANAHDTYECWEIQISLGAMEWKGLRDGDKTVSFSMVKVLE